MFMIVSNDGWHLRYLARYCLPDTTRSGSFCRDRFLFGYAGWSIKTSIANESRQDVIGAISRDLWSLSSYGISTMIGTGTAKKERTAEPIGKIWILSSLPWKDCQHKELATNSVCTMLQTNQFSQEINWVAAGTMERFVEIQLLLWVSLYMVGILAHGIWETMTMTEGGGGLERWTIYGLFCQVANSS